MPWEEGLRRGYDKNASHFKPKKYEKAFPKALAEAIEEHSKPKEQRSGGDVHTKTKKKPPIKKKVVRKQRDDDFISKDDSDDDMAALRAKKRSAPKKEGGSTVPKKPRTDEDKKRALDALAAKKREKREEEERKQAARDKKMKDARDSGVPVWKQLSGRAEDKERRSRLPRTTNPLSSQPTRGVWWRLYGKQRSARTSPRRSHV